ncbi:MAG: MATE family efflux transporter [Gemmatimonadaceae bacterium]|jgi:MATE family multidrug resistance protein|nr:MATE family efflux transporter [Gemmatimonadaceae bacterium]
MGRIAAPIVTVSVGVQLMGVVDGLMVGRLGGAAIASVALGNFYFFNVAVFGMGLLYAIDPVVAQAVGAGDTVGVARGVQRGLLLALAASVVIMLALLPGEFVLGALKQPTDVIEPTAQYARRRLLAAVPFLVFSVWRQALQAMGTVRPVVLAVLAANVVNVLANYALIEGRLGAPALGVVGAGWATVLAQWTMALLLLWFAWPILGPTMRPWDHASFAWAPLRRMIGIGAPIGTQWFFEGFAFGLTTLFMGWMGTASLAGHEIALNMASLTFMVPLGFSGAAAAVVGRAIGRGDVATAKRDAFAAIVCAVLFMSGSAAVFLAVPEFLATRYTTEAATVAVAVSLIPIAGVFQVFDGTQAVTSGVLRGTGDTRVPAILHMVAFWGIGIPLGAALGFLTPLRERGLWWGLTAGLAAAAVLQTWRVVVRLRGNITRVQLDVSAPAS